MAFSGGFDEMSGGELLDTADVLACRIVDAEAQLLVVAYQWAIINSPDTVDPKEAGLPGRQTLRRYGGSGTPEVASFAPAELGARTGRSTWAGEQLVADALDLHHRLPRLGERVRAGEVRASYARHVARRTRDLDRDAADYVDERVVESADGRITPADTFPFATSTVNQTDGWRSMQIDHTIAYGDGGQSAIGNYGPLTGQHHRIKTHGHWDVQQPYPGIYLWRDPHGQHYLVDHTGTQRLRKDDAA